MSLVGRDRELAEVLRELRSPSGTGLVIAGPAGIGKSQVLAEALSSRQLAGMAVVSVRASAAAATIPYGVFAGLLPVDPQPRNTLRWAIETLAPVGRRVLIGVDDAHLLDPASAVVLHMLAHTGRARILATIRSGEPAPDAVQSLWKDELVARMDLGPLDEWAVAASVAEMLPGPVAPATVRRFFELSGGNPLLLRELVLATRDSGALVGPPWRLATTYPTTSPRLVELLQQRIGSLDAQHGEVLELVALGEPLALDQLLRLCSAEVVEDCEARGLITVSAAVVRLGHPLFGEVARARCGSLRTARRSRELAGSASEPVDPAGRLRLVGWQLDGGVADDPGLLLEAARIAWAGYNLQLALRLGDAARAVGGGVDAAVLLAALRNEALEPAAALGCLDEVAQEPMSEQHRAEVAIARAFAVALSPDGTDSALAVLRAARPGISDRKWLQQLDVLAMQLRSRTAAPAATLADADELIAAGPATAALRAQMLSARAGSSVALGRFGPAAAAARSAVAEMGLWRDEVPSQFMPLHLNWCWAALHGGDLDQAEQAVAATEDGVRDSVDWRAGDNALVLVRSQVLRMRGELGEAATQTQFVQSGLFAAGCHAERAHVLALLGDATGARGALDAARQALTSRFTVSERGWILLAQPWVWAAGHDVAGAVAVALEGIEEVARHGYRSLEAVLCHIVVRLGAAEVVLERLTALVADAGDPLQRCYGRHGTAVCAGDGPELVQVAAEFADLGYLVHAADTAAHAAAALHRAGHSTAARAAERSAVRWGGGARTPALAALLVPGLTSREREVAGYAAAGMSSREIATRLVVSIRTVDNHLRAVYSKVGVANRRELAAVLAAPRGQPGSRRGPS